MQSPYKTEFERNKITKTGSQLSRVFVFSIISILLVNIQSPVFSKSSPNKPSFSKPTKPLVGSASMRQVSDGDLSYLLNRITFGPRPYDLQSLRTMGIGNYINQQLNPKTIQESPVIANFVNRDADLSASPLDLYNAYGPPAVKAAVSSAMLISADDRKMAQKIVRKEEKQLNNKFAQLHLMRAQYSNKQLQEVMTDFWFNHFNIYGEKGLDRVWIGPYEDVAIRPYALGKFRDLLGATCHHSAMLFYLDNWQNSAAPNVSPLTNGQIPNTPKGRFSGLNENYARELMELHTLGVDGGYNQQDVIQLAKILTGLGLPPRNPRALTGPVDPVMGCYFDQKRHDYSDKVLLGHPIKGSGEAEIEDALDLLASRPATAHHICYELAQYFVADKPPTSLVDKLTLRFKRTNGDIKAVMNDLLTSNEFWDPRYRYAKYKNPFRYAVSTLRATNAQPDSYEPVMGFLRQQGMPIYGCITPDGYKNTKEAWLNSDTLLKRIGFAADISSGRMRNLCPEPPDYTVVGTIFGSTLTPNTVRVITKAPDKIKLALLLGSPEFMLY